MFSRHRLIGFIAMFLLLVMQAFWLSHSIEYDLSSNAHVETECEFCLAMHGMGAAIPEQEPVSVVASGEYRLEYAYTSIIRIHTESIPPRQQGPPAFS
jgi:hypothetical protein